MGLAMPAKRFLPLTPTLGALYFQSPCKARLILRVSLAISSSVIVNTSSGCRALPALWRDELQLVVTGTNSAAMTQKKTIKRLIVIKF